LPWVQLGLSHLDRDKDEVKWPYPFDGKFTSKLWMCSIKLVTKWICGFFVWGDVVWTHLNGANVWVFWKSIMNSWHDWFSYYINLRMTRISSMDTKMTKAKGLPKYIEKQIMVKTSLKYNYKHEMLESN